MKTIDEEIKEEVSEIDLNESGMVKVWHVGLDFDIFTDNEEKKNTKKRKGKTTSRKLWT